ncbi:type II toxin-antitoxin system RelE/ParE family toxin [Mycolicibacterium mucogenicum]|uniref:type II toxin-antitoxin system RelE/ParE family toxin n=1 Tax=Mycolicibacterium mucogenicum TaxID=56689 RepID=UPI00226A207B|nr:type II toxin-antitoxin system RelE/ParE family toxin [Mycolicibacterium mucogenicum]MCX8565048.1 type II toxin-antitoxin system RelE/ParE family toxin [Mycolicibacterium mucogenicum]
MSRVFFKPAAIGDLDRIWDYTADRWDAAPADEYLRELEHAFGRIGDNPMIGRACDEVRTGYRKHSVASHTVYYRLTGADVEVVRILHQQMDVDRHLLD